MLIIYRLQAAIVSSRLRQRDAFFGVKDIVEFSDISDIISGRFDNRQQFEQARAFGLITVRKWYSDANPIDVRVVPALSLTAGCCVPVCSYVDYYE